MNRSKMYPESAMGRSVMAVVALVAVIILMAVPALASSDLGRTDEGVEVPFRLALTFEETDVAFDPARCGSAAVLVTLGGEGQGTHLGQFALHETHCAAPPLTIFDLEGMFTAADGSELFFEGQNFELIPTEAPGLFAIEGDVTFTGGTGRFEGAIGSAEAGGILELATDTGMVNLEGTLILLR